MQIQYCFIVFLNNQIYFEMLTKTANVSFTDST